MISLKSNNKRLTRFQKEKDQLLNQGYKKIICKHPKCTDYRVLAYMLWRIKLHNFLFFYLNQRHWKYPEDLGSLRGPYDSASFNYFLRPSA